MNITTNPITEAVDTLLGDPNDEFFMGRVEALAMLVGNLANDEDNEVLALVIEHAGFDGSAARYGLGEYVECDGGAEGCTCNDRCPVCGEPVGDDRDREAHATETCHALDF